jgi:hypothetical protein
MNKSSIFFILIVFLFSCKTTDDSLIFNTNQESKSLIDDSEKLILEYKFNNNKESIKKAKAVIEKLDDQATNNKYLEAVVFGLYAELDLALKNYGNIKLYTAEIDKRNKSEERLYIIMAESENDQVKKEKILSSGIKKASTSGRLKLLQAINYFSIGRYKDAVGLFDDAFVNLPEYYAGYYKILRNLSFQFIENQPKSSETLKILLKNELTVNDLIKIIYSESKLLSGIINSDTTIVSSIYDKLKQENYFYLLNKLELNDIIKRKDIAYFLIHLAAYFEKDLSILTKYQIKDEDYLNALPKSLLPDVKANEYYYSTALVLVEREMLELPDGINFMPNESISGLKFYEIIQKFINLYSK